ncbi:nicotinate-nucleotide--dimethylbenzimidazole phosphoribosyltransferase [Microlunatus capsulatus]|uniref:Nicotinate-nucleotide--dimethylbenzimidazole phosphoribosyltransferase n=1 Tax=Microlunatus capsulatus TaxID=99117 RepID=A0ABS4Z7X2_9ACTN|nr:nicotinate-nucleotide--dimethylbenzimidazole phosphoribosyltransferase [Microlunatus capsulatus]MBP2417145.1 nicotinate-nucleotide--dimethylbenzimidazole phosphoribosyltransferase [Microlunatus capsulatus]
MPTAPSPDPRPLPAPDPEVRAAARTRLDALAKPLGALGRVEELAAWWSACAGRCPADPPAAVRAVILAGDHGVSADGVSAYPREVTAAMVRAFVAGVAGASVLARQHDVALRVLDLAVDADLDDLPGVAEHKVRRSSGAVDREDALTAAQTWAALDAGALVAAEEVAAGADLLVLGDMGIGNTTPAAALVAASLGAPAEQVVGRGTGVDDARLAHKTAVVTRALARAGDRVGDPVERLTALGSADLAAGVGFLVAAARARVPVLLDGVVPLAELLVAEDLQPGVVAWCAAGHRSTEPAQRLALEKLGLEPVLDLGLRLGEGTGALTALPVLRSAALLLRDMALLADLAP